MDQLIKKRYNKSILREAMQRYGFSKDPIQSFEAVENFVYEFERDSNAFILRVAHSSRRTESLVLGEVDWINFLAKGGVSVSRAIFSNNGKLVEAIEDHQGGSFLVTAFVKAQGQAPWELWTPKLYESYGQLIGRIHSLSKRYQPHQPAWKRPDWDDHVFDFVERYLPDSESVAKKKYKDACDHVNCLAKDRESYGLIHHDAHGNNMFVDKAGQITLFDFDDCAYNWFVNEIAIVLFYVVQDAEDWHTFTQEFMTHFLHGYVQACPLDPAWLKEIPYFLKIREIILFAAMYRDFDVKNIDNEWCARFMSDRKFKIDHDEPFIEFDFESLSAQISNDQRDY